MNSNIAPDADSNPKRGLVYTSFISLCKMYLVNSPSTILVTDLLLQLPEVMDVCVGELKAAIALFERFQRTQSSVLFNDELINASYLVRVLEGRRLPRWDSLEDDLFVYSSSTRNNLLPSIFKELADFEFLNSMFSPMHLVAALVIATYRTYVLHLFEDIRDSNGQVASTLEEMLAVLALSNCQTQLFASTKHWIMDYQVEGFSPALAARVAMLDATS